MNTHDGCMEQFRARGFIGADSLEPTVVAAELRMVGEISCLGDIVISVDKTLTVLGGEGDDALVQTIEYAYNASVRGRGNILRHDNAHGNPNHEDAHHRHEFDWRTGRLISLVWVGAERWPTLGDFIDEIEVWYWAHRAELPYPNTFAPIGLR